MSNLDELDAMEPEYDFSKGERGKFYNPNAVLQIPVYLSSSSQVFRNMEAIIAGGIVEQLVNEWLRNSIEIIQSVQPEPSP